MSKPGSLFYPESYLSSRHRFLSYLPAFQRKWPNAFHLAHPLPGPEDLTTDLIRADARGRRERALLITTGLHGVEGFMGSAVLDLFVSEFLPRIQTEYAGVVLVHALNPWGMYHQRRVNSANVDLNRNFLDQETDFESIDSPGYRLLDPMLNPERSLRSVPVESWRLISRMLIQLARHGIKTLRDAVLLGQRFNPRGLYYCGESNQPETCFFKGLLESLLGDYQEVIQIDVHSGYGPRTQMSLVNSAAEPAAPEQLREAFNYPRILRADPDDFYAMQGDMIDFAYRLAGRPSPGGNYFGTAFEFGTYGAGPLAEIRSLGIMVLENMLYHFGAGSAQVEKAVRKQFFEFFLPGDPAWREKAEADARQALSGILTARNLI